MTNVVTRLKSFAPKALWDRLSAWAAQWRIAKAMGRRPGLAYGFMPFLLVVSFASLVGLNLLVSRLEGQLAYGVVVTAIAFWALGQTRPVRWLLGRWGDPGFSLGRSLVWAIFIVVGVPIAIDKRWTGVVALFVPLVAWVSWRVYVRLRAHRLQQSRRRRQAWPAAIMSIALLVVAVELIQPSLSDKEAPSGGPPVAAAPADADLALAREVRPLLQFDAGESRFPLDIDDALADERVRTCQGDKCSPKHLERFEDLDLGADYLLIDDFAGVPGGGAGSAYYYHVDDKARPNRIYVDFWWYFTRNPSPIGATIGCGPAVRWVGLTCHDHPSDWEGVTVVLGPCPEGELECVGPEKEWSPLAVRYAQHDDVASYSWSTLVQLWRTVRNRPATRPVVFVARDSHASYPSVCTRDCKQYAHYLFRWNRDEGNHGGERDWRWNDVCTGCLRPLPITDDEGFAASWNAYPGRWGHQVCILWETYCDTSAAPWSPSMQDRYRDPGANGPWLCVEDPRPRETAPLLTFCGDADPDKEIPN